MAQMRRSGRVLLLSAAIGIAVTIFLASCAVKSRNAAPINPAVQKDLKANDVTSFDIFGIQTGSMKWHISAK